MEEQVFGTGKFKYFIGSDLREHPVDIVLFQQGITELEKAITAITNPKEKATQYSRLGVLYRVIKKLEQSEHALSKAASIIEEFKLIRLSITNNLRMAQTLQFKKQYEEADLLYAKLEQEITTSQQHLDILDFIYQHRGKNQFEQGNLQHAIFFLNKALSIRINKKDKALLQSTKFALETIQQAQNEN